MLNLTSKAKERSLTNNDAKNIRDKYNLIFDSDLETDMKNIELRNIKEVRPIQEKSKMEATKYKNIALDHVPVIAVDFDGVINMAEYPNVQEEPNADAYNTLTDARAHGCQIILYTCREGKALLDAINHCLRWGYPISRVNDNTPPNIEKYGGNSRKVFADIYIDERQVGGLPDWCKIRDYLEQFYLPF